MADEFKGFSKVFSFTFARHTGTKGYRRTTGFVALALFLIPLAIFLGFALLDGENDEPAPLELGCGAETVYVADSTEKTDYSLLNSIGNEDFVFEYVACSSAEEALAKASEDEKSLVLAVEKDEYNYDISVILPENSSLTDEDSSSFGEFISMNFEFILMAKSGLSPEQLAVLYTPPISNISVPEEEYTEEIYFEKADEGTDELIVYITCYLNIMVLYFMVLFYGQGVANSVIIEKTSKLMDFFLVTVKPGAMVLGKVFAVSLAGMIQIFIWVASLIFGVLSGAFFGGMLSSEVKAAVEGFLSVFDIFSGMFSVSSIILALLITFSGMFLYSALASIGGSLASKPEDLSSTNQIFTLVLVASFFAVLFTGGNGELISSAGWLNWIPFTAVLITPGRVLAGEVSLIEGTACLLLILVFSVGAAWFAGKVYKLMSLYKGDPPKLSKVFEMMKNSK